MDEQEDGLQPYYKKNGYILYKGDLETFPFTLEGNILP